MQADGKRRGECVFIAITQCDYVFITSLCLSIMCLCVYVYKYTCIYVEVSRVTEAMEELIRAQPNLASRQRGSQSFPLIPLLGGKILAIFIIGLPEGSDSLGAERDGLLSSALIYEHTMLPPKYE